MQNLIGKEFFLALYLGKDKVVLMAMRKLLMELGNYTKKKPEERLPQELIFQILLILLVGITTEIVRI